MTKTHNLTEGSLVRGILFFSLPLVFSNILQVLFNMADVAVVGQFASAAAMGAVGSTTAMISLFTGLLIGIGTGVNVLTARCIGAHDRRGTAETVHTSLVISILCGVILLILCEIFTPAMLQLLNTKEELLDGAILYSRIYFLGLPALALYNFGSGVYSGAGNTKKPLVYLTIGGVLNVILNLFFVIVCKMDVEGVALSSVITQYISAALTLIALARENADFALHSKEIRMSPGRSRAILGFGIPAALQNVVFQVANMCIQAALNSFDTVVVEGATASANADTLVYNVVGAFCVACSSYVAQNLGANQKKRVRDSYLISMAYSFGIALVLGLAFSFFGEEFMALFTTDAEVAAAGAERLWIMGLSYAVSAFMDCTIAAARGLGKSFAPTVIVIMGSCVFRVIWVYTVFAAMHTILSLYLLYVFSWAITAIFEIWYFLRAYRQI